MGNRDIAHSRKIEDQFAVVFLHKSFDKSRKHGAINPQARTGDKWCEFLDTKRWLQTVSVGWG